jgi:hypothetical protein
LLGFFTLKNPSLCCEATFGLKVTLQQSGLARPKPSLGATFKITSASEVVLKVALIKA